MSLKCHEGSRDFGIKCELDAFKFHVYLEVPIVPLMSISLPTPEGQPEEIGLRFFAEALHCQSRFDEEISIARQSGPSGFTRLLEYYFDLWDAISAKIDSPDFLMSVKTLADKEVRRVLRKTRKQR